jgi:RecB family exonuclease
LVLSYPLLNGKGEANMPSFFLERMRERCALQEEKAVRCRPRPAHAARHTPLPAISDEGLRAVIKARHVSFTPTAIETFLQCPYQFFAEKTLKLEEVPPDPSDRLDALVQGLIAHDALHLMYRDGITLAQAFEAAWADRCAKARVLPGYRNEAVRLELFRNLQRFVNSAPLPASSDSEYESKITMQLPDGTEIKGRMDRIDVDAQGRVLVIDYKYKRETGIRQLVKAHDNGTLVQGGLYVLALRSAGLQPAGMVYAGFRREASFGGWIVDGAFSDLEQACSTEELNDVVRRAVEVSVRSMSEIHDGRIAPAPADEAKCDRCAYASACRVEVAAPRAVTTLSVTTGAGE